MKTTRIFSALMALIALFTLFALPAHAEQAAPTYPDKALAIIELVNKEREKYGLKPVSLDDRMMEAAAKRAREQQTLYSHTRPDGTGFYTVFDEFKINYELCGENLGMSSICSAERIVQGWMNSPTHRENILCADFTRIGVALAESGSTCCWAQLFAV